MAHAKPMMTNFSSGEFSPKVGGRIDLEQYYNSCRLLENFIVNAQGNAERTPGTYYVCEVKDSDDKIRLIPFKKSVDTQYVIEFGDLYVRFYKDHEQIESGGSPYEIVSPYALADLFELQFIQVQNVMYIVHPSYKPRTLTCSGDTSWAFANYAPTADPFTGTDDYPSCICIFEARLIFGATNNDPNTIWGTKSLDFDDMTIGTGDGDGFSYDLPCERIRSLTSHENIVANATDGEYFVGTTSGLLSPTNIHVRRRTAHGSANIQAVLTGSNTIFVQKNLKTIRSMVYVLANENYIAYDLTGMADHVTGSGVTCIDVQRDPHIIFWAVTKDGELAGLTYSPQLNIMAWHRKTTDGEIESLAIITGASGEDEIWISVKREIDGSDVRYIEYFKPRDFGSDQSDCFFVDCGITFDGGAAVNITSATKADPVVITSVGHPFENNDLVKITGVLGMTELNNHVYMVKNKAADTFELYTEDGSDGINGTEFTTYTSGGLVQKVYKTLTGIDHLEAKEVSVFGDGAVQPDKTVSSGSIELKNHANKIHVGLPYTSILLLQRIEAGATKGTAQGKHKRIFKLVIRFYKTLNGKCGPSLDKLSIIPFRKTSDPMDTAPPLYSGDKIDILHSQWSTDGDLYIVQDTPTPMTILGIMPELKTND